MIGLHPIAGNHLPGKGDRVLVKAGTHVWMYWAASLVQKDIGGVVMSLWPIGSTVNGVLVRLDGGMVVWIHVNDVVVGT